MTSLDILLKQLNGSPPSSETLLTHSLFDQIVTHIEQENIDEAVDLIEKVFTKGVLDIRLVAYYLYAHFFNHGIKSFLEIFPSLRGLINSHWTTLRPSNRKDKQVQNSINWFILNLINKLKYCEKLAKTGKIHPIWNKSTLEISDGELKQIVAILREFQDFFQEKWPKSPTQDRLMHLLQIVRDLKTFVKEDPEPIPEVIEEVPEKEEEREMELPVEEDVLPTASEAPRSYSSEKMDHLTEKLRVFELLVSKNEFFKAALVAKDIEELIEHFDPTLYFPKMFAKYFSLLAKHVAALSEQWQVKESMQLKYLEKLYKTDVKSFIEW